MNLRSTCFAAIAAIAGAALLAPAIAPAQDLHPSRRPSPLGIARLSVDDAYVKVHYSRPYKRNREIFGTKESGALVPHGELWRTGANEATEITTTKDLMFGDQKLAAGTYSIFTVPGPEQWTIRFNSKLGLSGNGYFYPETGKFEAVDLGPTDVLSVTAPVTAIPADKEEVDQFTIGLAKADAGAVLVLRWVRTEVRVPFTVAK